MERVSSMKNEEFEYREVMPHPEGPRRGSLVVRVSAVGGGTVGRAYSGNWIYRVSYLGTRQTVMEGDDLRTGTPKTHAQVVRLIMDFYEDEAGVTR